MIENSTIVHDLKNKGFLPDSLVYVELYDLA